MAYEIAFRETDDSETYRQTLARRFENFDDAWKTARTLAEHFRGKGINTFELTFREIP